MHSSSPDSGTWLAADVGGTNTRCALLDHPHAVARKLRYYRNADYPELSALLRAYSADINENRPTKGVLAIAAPVQGDQVRMINRGWAFDRKQLERQLDLDLLHVINDFEAIGYSLMEVDRLSFELIGSARPEATGNRAVLGPGTGLGVSGLITDGRQRVVIRGEGGHMTLASRNSAEAKIIGGFRERYGHCSAERVLCGQGIVELHQIMHGENLSSAEEIATATSSSCQQTMQQFVRFFADVAADVTLTLGARGGVFIAGGILQKNPSLLQGTAFRERFEDKGRYRDYLAAIPSYLITDPVPAIAGLSAYIGTL